MSRSPVSTPARHDWSRVHERARSGCAVIMTTHILEVAERMADRIGVMVAGRLLAEGSLDELRRLAGAGHASLEDTFLALVESDGGERTVAA
jgi:ABC-2 type transport system ATP-binding protein